ncbi:MAG: twin-arginine translocase subunit TatB [Proteobacteria bacterium]|nr:twin-arginine translocase subunit TatB [Pseudomonadota bacterium]
MFNIGSSELILIAVVALIAIGPKELPGVLRMVGQWMGKARKMAGEFQGQFNEAMREAEMADLKKSFDEVREATSGLSGANLMTKLTNSLGEPPKLEDLDKPLADTPAALAGDPQAAPTPVEAPIPQTFTEADAHAAANEPLAITREFHNAASNDLAPAAVTPHETPSREAQGDAVKDAKAS